MIIELKGRIGDDGKIILDTPTTLPPRDVDIVISYVDGTEAQDEADWAGPPPPTAYQRRLFLSD